MFFHKLLLGLIACFSIASTCVGQTAHWSNVPEHVSLSLESFRDIFRNAHSQGTGITILGDSQETAPGGGGRFYVPALGHEFFEYYGNVPRSGFVTVSSQASAWMTAAGSQGALRTDSNNVLPDVTVGAYGNSIPAFGILAQVATDGYTTPFLDVPDSGYFNDHEVGVELVLRTRPDSAEVYWRANLTDDDRRSYYGGELIGTGTTNLGLARNEVEYLSTNIGSFDLDDHNALQIVARGAEDNLSVDIAGVRFHNQGDSSGVSVQTFSKGGNTTRQFLDSYNNAFGFFEIVAKDEMVAIQLGANDAGFGLSADGFKDDLEEMIILLRDGMDNPELPILLISDPDRDSLSETNRANFDLYPGVAAELALEYSNVLALNTRLIGARNNWYVGSSDFDSFVPDGVHYSQLGGMSLAKWQAESLLNLAVVFEKGDVNRDGDVNFFDIPRLIAAMESGVFQAEADCDCSKNVDFGDISAFISILVNQ